MTTARSGRCGETTSFERDRRPPAAGEAGSNVTGHHSPASTVGDTQIFSTSGNASTRTQLGRRQRRRAQFETTTETSDLEGAERPAGASTPTGRLPS
jgi:hypothetical protein